MTCPGCDKPEGGLYIVGCRRCALRRIARGLPFADSIREGSPTDAYKRQLAALGKPTAVHREVLVMQQELRMRGVVA